MTETVRPARRPRAPSEPADEPRPVWVHRPAAVEGCCARLPPPAVRAGRTVVAEVPPAVRTGSVRTGSGGEELADGVDAVQVAGAPAVRDHAGEAAGVIAPVPPRRARPGGTPGPAMPPAPCRRRVAVRTRGGRVGGETTYGRPGSPAGSREERDPAGDQPGVLGHEHDPACPPASAVVTASRRAARTGLGALPGEPGDEASRGRTPHRDHSACRREDRTTPVTPTARSAAGPPSPWASRPRRARRSCRTGRSSRGPCRRQRTQDGVVASGRTRTRRGSSPALQDPVRMARPAAAGKVMYGVTARVTSAVCRAWWRRTGTRTCRSGRTPPRCSGRSQAISGLRRASRTGATATAAGPRRGRDGCRRCRPRPRGVRRRVPRPEQPVLGVLMAEVTIQLTGLPVVQAARVPARVRPPGRSGPSAARGARFCCSAPSRNSASILVRAPRPAPGAAGRAACPRPTCRSSVTARDVMVRRRGRRRPIQLGGRPGR